MSLHCCVYQRPLSSSWFPPSPSSLHLSYGSFGLARVRSYLEPTSLVSIPHADPVIPQGPNSLLLRFQDYRTTIAPSNAMGLGRRLLGSPPFPTPLIHGVSGQEEGHFRHAVIALARNPLPLCSFRLQVRVSINLRDPRLNYRLVGLACRSYFPQPWLASYNWAQSSLSAPHRVTCN